MTQGQVIGQYSIPADAGPTSKDVDELQTRIFIEQSSQENAVVHINTASCDSQTDNHGDGGAQSHNGVAITINSDGSVTGADTIFQNIKHLTIMSSRPFDQVSMTTLNALSTAIEEYTTQLQSMEISMGAQFDAEVTGHGYEISTLIIMGFHYPDVKNILTAGGSSNNIIGEVVNLFTRFVDVKIYQREGFTAPGPFENELYAQIRNLAIECSASSSNNTEPLTLDAQMNTDSCFETLKGLRALSLRGVTLQSLEKLQALKKLKQLKLSSISVQNPVHLPELPLIKHLQVTNSGINEFFIDKPLLKLTELNLTDNKISKIFGVSNAPNLEVIELAHNSMQDLGSFRSCKCLKRLQLSHNQITQMRFTKDMDSLEELDLSDNKISEIENLHGLRNLKSLNLLGNRIARLKNLDQSPQLLKLSVSLKSQPKDGPSKIDGLEHLPNLESLVLDVPHVKILENVSQLCKLTSLEVSAMELKDIERSFKYLMRDNSLRSLKITTSEPSGKNTWFNLQALERWPAERKVHLWRALMRSIRNEIGKSADAYEDLVRSGDSLDLSNYSESQFVRFNALV